jgi:hypothetical protein
LDEGARTQVPHILWMDEKLCEFSNSLVTII